MLPHAHALQIPPLAPDAAFARLSSRPRTCWIDSSLPRLPDGRFSILSSEPRWVLRARDGAWQRYRGTSVIERGDGDPLQRLDALLREQACRAAPEASHLPFHGGVVGFLSYDLGRSFEDMPEIATPDTITPDLWFAWFDAAAVWDHEAQALWLVGVDGERSGHEAISELRGWLEQPAPAHSRLPSPAPRVAHSNLAPGDYMARVAQAREGIARGEYYQLNLVQRFSCTHDEPAAETYLRLRELNPAPFSAFIAADDLTVLSSSPERFIEVTPEGRIRTCPIKGTRPRSTVPAEDEARRSELISSSKERAELLMIVDLMRNDLGRVCVPGSVDVSRLYALESFATVHHLVGEVQGQLRPGITPGQLWRATFPGGSITGAPKVSAMRAIEALEPNRRGIGMGAIGYVSAHGRMDLNIAIRTIVTSKGVAQVPVGAGIVWDSEPAAEYAETLAKARAQFAALGVTSLAP